MVPHQKTKDLSHSYQFDNIYLGHKRSVHLYKFGKSANTIELQIQAHQLFNFDLLVSSWYYICNVIQLLFWLFSLPNKFHYFLSQYIDVVNIYHVEHEDKALLDCYLIKFLYLYLLFVTMNFTYFLESKNSLKSISHELPSQRTFNLLYFLLIK